ncbi:MAG: N-acetyltransferase [Deltaproteobacteria bacterium]|nr:MAG: N-acetyltransferase [Deltaproteobacteria bacterium]
MNPIERIFTTILTVMFGLFGAIVRGILGAPATAVRKLTAPLSIDRARTPEIIDLRHQVLRQGRPRASAHFEGDNEDATRHWAVRQSGQIIGIATVLGRPFPQGDGPRWQLRGMAVHPEHQGRGVGKALLSAIEVEVGEPMWCNARTSAASFYERQGWQRRGETFDIPDVGPHIRMIRDPQAGAIDVQG